jgi:uncharacterized delta-60 repeat protein
LPVLAPFPVSHAKTFSSFSPRFIVVCSRSSFARSSALIAAAALTFAAHAQDGFYDPTFGDGGRTFFDVTGSAEEAGKMIRLPNGNFLIVGVCGQIPCAAWLSPTGALATGYGTSGTGTAIFSDFPGWPSDAFKAYDAAAFADGRVAVIVSKDGSGSYLAMLRQDGSGLDPSVGNGAGFVSPSFYAQLVRVTAQQQVIVAGWSQGTPEPLVFARYDSTFHVDSSFGSSGSRTIGFPDGDAFPNGMTLQKDGKIVAIGSAGSSLVIVRLTAGGNPDSEFGINSDGRFESTFGNTYGAAGLDIVQDKQGRLVFAGYARTDNVNGSEWLVNRLLGGGATDASFNNGQPQQFTIFDSSQLYYPAAFCVALQRDGRIVVAGTKDRATSVPKYFATARFLGDGTFDYSYGGGGQAFGDMSSRADSMSDYPDSMVVVPGGIVIGGTTHASGPVQGFSVTKVQIDLLFGSDFE